MLEWNLYREINQKIEKYNIFKHANFVKSLIDMFKDIKKEEKKYIKEYNLTGLISNKEYEKSEKYIKNFSDKRLNLECQYHFWGRCECEIILTTWPTFIDREEIYKLVEEDQKHFDKYGDYAYSYTPKLSNAVKIDIYEQLRLNWDQFKKYVFDNEKEIKKLYERDFKRYFKK